MQTEIRLEGAASASLLGAVTVFSTQLAAGFVTLHGGALSLAACGNPIEKDLAAPVAVNIRELHERLVPRVPAALGLRKLLSPADLAAGIENRQDAVAERPMMRIARRQKSDEHQRNQGSAGEQACCHEPESALAGFPGKCRRRFGSRVPGAPGSHPFIQLLGEGNRTCAPPAPQPAHRQACGLFPPLGRTHGDAEVVGDLLSGLKLDAAGPFF
jgi:hypothetical protein